MRFTVPQFIEMESKIVGPFTFSQFIFVGLAGAIGFVLYFSVSFPVFLATTIILMFVALALAFLKIGGRSLSTMLKNFFMFSFSPKIYLWERKEASPKTIMRKEMPKKKEVEEGPLLKIAGKSRLKQLSAQVEIKIK